MNSSITIKFNYKRILLLCAFSLLILLGSVYLWIKRENNELRDYNRLVQMASYVGVPVGLFLFAGFFYPLISRKPACLIDNQGITDYSGFPIGFGKIYWKDISTVELYKNSNGKSFLGIYLPNPTQTLANYTSLKKAVLTGFHGFNNGVVVIQIEKLNISPEELVLAVKQYKDNGN